MAQLQFEISDIENGNQNLHDDEDDDAVMHIEPLVDFLLKEPSKQNLAPPATENLNNINKVKTPPIKKKWKMAIQRARSLEDPWAKFHLEDFTAETATRHRYNAVDKSWVQDEVQVKMASEAFAHGAMRECFRMKKLSNFCKHLDWKHAGNFVAKSYMETVDRDVYFQDVRLQMDAKVWGEEFNRHNPPKKVDIFQMAVLEFSNRPGKPLFHLESYIEGKYIKYNSNSGFVRDEALRQTPQAFSHFTFERSGHKLIVVDIQGVGDLYTDPQIHTSTGKEYNEGNLGCRGMALFFATHACNQICEHLELTPFDLHSSEITDHEKYVKLQKESNTICRGTENRVYKPRARPSISPLDMTQFVVFERSNSQMSTDSADSSVVLSPISDSPPRRVSFQEPPSSPDDVAMSMSPQPSYLENFRRQTRFRTDSESETLAEDEEKRARFLERNVNHRPSCVNLEVQLRKSLLIKNTGGSILGQIHLDLAKYHEMGRLAPDDNSRNMEAAIYHLRHAADCGVLEGIIAMARICLQLTHDILTEVVVPESDDYINEGMDYMEMACDAGDRAAMLIVARAYDNGLNLGSARERSWLEAMHWYEEAVNCTSDDEDGHFDATMEDPNYQINARMAEMYRSGGPDLDKNPERAAELYNEAAEGAVAAMKGRLSNKYFMLAEECYGEMEE
ncbi:eukaryotic elongation factor 2 kinase-like [Diadema antillarum]|uniref:eukaryotic elongation factor 2 kinase-like n=1 Tax=Diadema antillarum TaxID=105358 RepID=UPI003A88A59F